MLVNLISGAAGVVVGVMFKTQIVALFNMVKGLFVKKH